MKTAIVYHSHHHGNTKKEIAGTVKFYEGLVKE